VMLAFTSALVMGGLFLLWAASVHGSLG